eukprot:SM000040S14753  [mRNA]  locus=s40:168450:169468:+ [translate_table: standard]
MPAGGARCRKHCRRSACTDRQCGIGRDASLVSGLEAELQAHSRLRSGERLVAAAKAAPRNPRRARRRTAPHQVQSPDAQEVELPSTHSAASSATTMGGAQQHSAPADGDRSPSDNELPSADVDGTRGLLWTETAKARMFWLLRALGTVID